MLPHRDPRRDVATWSETIWFGCWNESDRTGLFVHAGRHRDNLDLWWVQTIVYLPDGRLAVDRSWAHGPDLWTFSSPVFSLRGRPDGSATATYRGVPEILTTAELTTQPGGAGPGTSVTWEVDLRPVRERWTMGGHGADWGDAHTQQQYAATGSVTLDGTTLSLDGPGWGDHSSGTRSWDGFGGHFFVNVPAAEDSLVVIAVRTPEGQPAMTVGAVRGSDGGTDDVVGVEGGWISDLLGGPQAFDLTVRTASGRELTWQVEVQHTFPASITELNDNINGLDWRAAGNPLFLTECVARFTSPDGTVAHGHLERSAKRSAVDPQTRTVRTA